MPRRKFTDQKIKAVLKELDAGISVEKISHKYGVSERTVYRWKATQNSPAINQTLPLGEAKAQLEDPTVVQHITDHLGDLPDWKRNHVAARIAELAQAVFGRPGVRRPATIPKVLKKARKQFEIRTHKRLIDIVQSTVKTIEALNKLSLPAGVDIKIKASAGR